MTTTWTAAAATTRGLGHERRGEPCEDASTTGADRGWTWIAVADGHGSPRCPRAAEGARLAVRAAGVIADLRADEDDAALRLGVDLIPGRIVDAWRAAVSDDAEDRPFGAEERTTIGDRPTRSAYGTTLLLAAVSRRWLVVVQVGDGDVLLATSGHRSARLPIPPMAGLARNVTQSLSQADAEAAFRTTVVDLDDDAPDIVFLATDGFANAFESDRWHDETATQLLDVLASPDVDPAHQLQSWVAAPARIGGDDVSLATLISPRLRPSRDSEPHHLERTEP